jgi:hypothetical protein
MTFRLAGAVVFTALLTTPTVAQTRIWRPDERVVLRDYGFVYQVATTNEAVYAATAGGLIVYNALFDRWLPPITELDGYPGGEVVTAMVGDRLDESLWIGAVDEVVHYRPRIQLVERIRIGQLIETMFFDSSDPSSPLYVGTSTRQWFVLSAGSSIPVRVTQFPPSGSRASGASLQALLRVFPAADPLQAVVLSEGRRQHRLTSGAADPMNRRAYFGTDGLGLVRYDAGVARLERLPYGLLADGVGAVLLADGGVWTGTTVGARPRTVANAPPYTPGFSWVRANLEESRLDRGPGTLGYGFRDVRDLARWEDQLWAATDAGVVPVGGGRSSTIDRQAGLPANDVYALAPSPAGLWVGTSRGLALLGDGGANVELAEATVGAGVIIDALAVDGAGVWAGGPNGLLFLPDGTDRVTMPALTSGEPLLGDRVAALAVVGRQVVVAIGDRILWRDATGRWTHETPLGLGPLTALTADGDGVWVGGELGVQYFTFDSREFQTAAGAGDLPARVRDLAASRDYLWVATEGGLVRIEKRVVLR